MKIRNMFIDGEVEYELLTLPIILLSISYFLLFSILGLFSHLRGGDWNMLFIIVPIMILSALPSVFKAYNIGKKFNENKKIKTILVIVDTTFKMLFFSSLIVYLIAAAFKLFGGHTGDMGFGMALLITGPFSLIAGPISGAYLSYILRK